MRPVVVCREVKWLRRIKLHNLKIPFLLRQESLAIKIGNEILFARFPLNFHLDNEDKAFKAKYSAFYQ